MSKKNIQSTTNYLLFVSNLENRPLDLKKHKKLMKSMTRWGFLRCFPIVVFRDAAGRLIVKDGQHRLAIAQKLGLAVYWIEEETDFDIAEVNETQMTWCLRDYADKHIANGKEVYADGLEFSKRHRLPLGTAFALLAGTTSFSNCQEDFMGGSFKIKDQEWADSVAGIYGPFVAMNQAIRSVRFIEACMAVCRVKDFCAKRMLACAERCREKLVPYSTKEAYLDMLEAIYNFGRKQLVGLKSAAIMAMRERSPMGKAKGEGGK